MPLRRTGQATSSGFPACVADAHRGGRNRRHRRASRQVNLSKPSPPPWPRCSMSCSSSRPAVASARWPSCARCCARPDPARSARPIRRERPPPGRHTPQTTLAHRTGRSALPTNVKSAPDRPPAPATTATSAPGRATATRGNRATRGRSPTCTRVGRKSCAAAPHRHALRSTRLRGIAHPRLRQPNPLPGAPRRHLCRPAGPPRSPRPACT